MKILVTGGGGFIGSHLVEALVARGDEVRVLDDFSTGKKANIEHLLDRVDLIEGSLTSFHDCATATEGMSFVLHQGAIPSVPRSIAEPFRTNKTNVTGTINLLDAARSNSIKRVIYASSSSVYGDSPMLPKVETMPPNPKSPYALQKYAAEAYMRMYHQFHGLETISLRYFNVFGPHQDPEGGYAAVIPKFITAMLKGESPLIHGDGQHARDFCYIDNVVSANLLALEASEKACGQTFNIACGDMITLGTLVDEINAILGTEIKPTHGPERAGDVQLSKADVTQAKEMLGYEPSFAFLYGLGRTVRWYLDEHNK